MNTGATSLAPGSCLIAERALSFLPSHAAELVYTQHLLTTSLFQPAAYCHALWKHIVIVKTLSLLSNWVETCQRVQKLLTVSEIWLKNSYLHHLSLILQRIPARCIDE